MVGQGRKPAPEGLGLHEAASPTHPNPRCFAPFPPGFPLFPPPPFSPFFLLSMMSRAVH